MKRTSFVLLMICQTATIASAVADEAGRTASTAEPQITWHRIEKLKSLGPICFRLPEFRDNSFRLVFPEWITSREMNWHVRPQWKTAGSRASGTWVTGPYSLQLELKFTRQANSRVLTWEYEFHNGSKSPLTDVAAFNCLTLVDAPAFLDLSMQRTTVRQGDGKPVTLSDVKKTKGPRTMQFYGARGGLKITEFERFMRYRVTSTEQLAGDRIGVASADLRWTVQSIVDGRVAYFFNNWEPTHGCIHAAPILGDVPAGKTGTAKGRIVFSLVKREE